MAQRFEARVAVVTGAGSGIGRATAVQLAAEGARVVVADIDPDAGTETTAQIRGNGGEAFAFQVDVRLTESVQAMLAQAEQMYGGVDIVCNNAGVGTRSPIFEATDEELWERTLMINLRGVILGCKFAVPYLRRRGGGAIVNTASMAGIVGIPSDPVYAATKGGVVMLTRSLRLLKDEADIRVNCVCPSFVETPMLTGGSDRDRAAFAGFELLQPEEVAEVIVFLASDEAAELAGQAVRVVAGEAPMLLLNAHPGAPLQH